ncbi:MAG TPA: hypothetical protein VD838_10560 [Anaeromyxobacteraceae bacterium]|nr:hypothetical protein [Anaeromyxobacteraceae bacterium]
MRKIAFPLIGLFAVGVATRALAVERGIGGHIGFATPLVTVTEDDTTDIGDQFTLVSPIGISLKVSERVAIDFETQVVNPVDPSGTTSLVIAPGIIVNTSLAALGLRLASAIDAPANVGIIPLINRGLVPLGGGATWFVEAAFPTFVNSEPPDVAFNVVIHTGVGF